MNALRTILLLSAGALLAGCAPSTQPSVRDPAMSTVSRPRLDDARDSDSSPTSHSATAPRVERTRMRHGASSTRQAPVAVGE